MKNKEFNLPVLISLLATITAFLICLFINSICAFICLAAGIIITAVFAFYTKKRYNKILELNNYLELVCSGKYDLNINSNSEGELSILKNNLFKVISLLRFSNEALKKDKTYLSDSLADISHQLKTPLTSIMVMTDLINDENNIDKIKEFSQIIENQSDKMKWLIETLLKLSKLDAGTADFKNENFSIKQAVKESTNPFLLTLELKGISLVENVDDFTVRGDRNWSIEAFKNIIKNCIEHTDENGTLKIYTNRTSLYSEIVIEDNGCGIADEDLPHIFERFYHGKNASSDSVGIGLALAKTIFEQERGSITVESELNKGSRFSIKFYNSII